MTERSPVVGRRVRRAFTALALMLSALMLASGCASDFDGTSTEVSQSISPSQDAQKEAAPSQNAQKETQRSARSGPPQKAPAMGASAPVRLEIPSLGVDVSIIDLGLNTDGTLEVPPDAAAAGWYTGAPTPGETGPAIVTGHVDWDGVEGVFFDLRNLKPGAEIIILREDGSRAVFSASTIERFPKDAFPTETVYGDLDRPGLRLITCGGSFDESARSYRDNIVVFANLA